MRYLLAVSLLLLVGATTPSLTASLPKREPIGERLLAHVEHLSGSLECDACKLGVSVIQELFERGATEDAIVKAAIELCIVTKTEDENVCRLVIPEFKVHGSDECNRLFHYVHVAV